MEYERFKFVFMKKDKEFGCFDFIWIKIFGFSFHWFTECHVWWLQWYLQTKKYNRYFQISSAGTWGYKHERIDTNE